MIRQSRISSFLLLNESLGMSDLAGSPMCVNGMKVLTRAAEDGGIKLTKSGAFHRKFVTWAAEDFRWPDYEAEELDKLNKVLNEQDFPPLAVMHELLTGARLLRHYKGTARPTKAGKAIIGNHGALQAELFDTFFLALDHGAYERFPIEYEDADLVHFLGVVKNRLGDWARMSDLAGWCLPIDLITTSRFSPETEACYYLFNRLIRPLLWLGLVEEQPHDNWRMRIEDWCFRKTPLFERFIRFKPFQDGGWSIH